MKTADWWRRVRLGSLLAVGPLLLSPGLVAAQTVIDTIPVGTNPVAIAVNEVTNRIHVTNCVPSPVLSYGTPGIVTVIDGRTNSTTELIVGVCPSALAISPVTNTIYVVNFGKPFVGCGGVFHACGNWGSVTVIDGATNSGRTYQDLGGKPRAVAVNPITNKLYDGGVRARVADANFTTAKPPTFRRATSGHLPLHRARPDLSDARARPAGSADPQRASRALSLARRARRPAATGSWCRGKSPGSHPAIAPARAAPAGVCTAREYFSALSTNVTWAQAGATVIDVLPGRAEQVGMRLEF